MLGNAPDMLVTYRILTPFFGLPCSHRSGRVWPSSPMNGNLISFSNLDFTSDHPTLNRAFRIAIGDLFSNILPHQSGLLDAPRPMIMAGLDYETPWTRDAAINCWNGGSLLVPDAARNTLLGVLENTEGQALIGGEYWDKIIWVTGAWHHYLVTGDRVFLASALQTATATLEFMEQTEFDPAHNLFRGGACFQDGVAAYPDRYALTNGSSGIIDWISANPQERAPAGMGLPMMACSTNCLYYSAYLRIAEMLRELGLSGAEAYETKASRLREAILTHFWDNTTGSLAYLLDEQGLCRHQEGLGAAFALLFGVLDPSQAKRLFTTQHITPHGIPCVWPTFARYLGKNGKDLGRHSGTIWPQVNAFWAEAASRHNRTDLLVEELLSLASKADRDVQFTELYHSATGEIYGGLQEGLHDSSIGLWKSCRRQTWSATGFLRMILHGLLGLRFEKDGLRFQPQTVAPVTSFRLRGLTYRKTLFSLEVTGTGHQIASVHINGAPRSEARIAAEATGEQQIVIHLTN